MSLFVVDGHKAKPRRVFWAAHRHFDWVAWSQDARLLLIDDDHSNRRRLIASRGIARARSMPRLGGLPLWCCPVNPYATLNG